MGNEVNVFEYLLNKAISFIAFTTSSRVIYFLDRFTIIWNVVVEKIFSMLSITMQILNLTGLMLYNVYLSQNSVLLMKTSQDFNVKHQVNLFPTTVRFKILLLTWIIANKNAKKNRLIFILRLDRFGKLRSHSPNKISFYSFGSLC